MSLAAERQRHVASLTDQFVQMLARIGQSIQAVSALAPPESPALRQAVAALQQTCNRSQTEASQLPLHLDRLPSPTLTPTASDPLAVLTDREREILNLLANGYTYPAIADMLLIATNTVKDHLKRIYAKIGVGNRHAATDWFRAANQ